MLLLLLILLSNSSEAQVLSVGEKKAGKVSFYTLDGKRLGETGVGSFPHEQVLSADGRLIYISDNGLLWMTDPGEGTNSISIIDVASRKRTGTIDLGRYRRPHGMDLDKKTGHLIVTIENPNGLLLVDPIAKKVLRMFDVKGNNPHMAIFGPRGETAFVSNTNSGTLAAIRLNDGAVTLVKVGERPQGAVMTRDQRRLFLTVIDGKAVVLLDTTGPKVTGRIATSGGPARLALTPDEKTLVYNLQAEERCGFADVATGKEIGWVKIPGKPLSLSLSRDGSRAYLGLQDSDKIAIVSVRDRKVLRVIDMPRGSGPDTILELP
ncbi:MAG: hypothetical protein HYZ37_02935 [Candidatus Solibacter usitatus]|nr:hypothetical protein [Candidatus Solibacter usitatus]